MFCKGPNIVLREENVTEVALAFHPVDKLGLGDLKMRKNGVCEVYCMEGTRM